MQLANVFADYPYRNRPVDFVLRDGPKILAIGLARYDGDRGGAQEDDRIVGYKNCSDEILQYAGRAGLGRLKVIFLNDGPGLLLGTMWDDYASIESRHPGRAMVLTLRMVPARLTEAWLRSCPFRRMATSIPPLTRLPGFASPRAGPSDGGRRHVELSGQANRA